jgi:hypothetical protein
MLVRRHEKMMMRGWKINAQDIKGKNERCGSVTSCYGSGFADPYLGLTDPDLDLDSDPTPDPAPEFGIFVTDIQDEN